MRRYTFYLYEYDSQMPQCSKHYSIKMFGHNLKHAFKKTQQYVEQRNHTFLNYHLELIGPIKQGHPHKINMRPLYILIGLVLLIIIILIISGSC